MYALTTSQAYLASAATGMAILEDPTSKVIFAAASAWIQVSASVALRSIYSIIIEITKSQVALLAKKGATIVDQGGNYYSMGVITLSTLATNQFHASGFYRNNLNEEANPP